MKKHQIKVLHNLDPTFEEAAVFFCENYLLISEKKYAENHISNGNSIRIPWILVSGLNSGSAVFFGTPISFLCVIIVDKVKEWMICRIRSEL